MSNMFFFFTTQDNGWNPAYDKKFEFDIVEPDHALLRFAVVDKDFTSENYVGEFILPVFAVGLGKYALNALSLTQLCAFFIKRPSPCHTVRQGQ